MVENSQDTGSQSPRFCSFCKRSEAAVGPVVRGPSSERENSAFICASCLERCSGILDQQKHEVESGRTKTNATFRNLFEDAVTNLSDQEFRVIELRYGLATGYPYSLEEVGEDLEITPEAVAEIEAGAVAKLKAGQDSR
jgi:RNA polymerase sigma factor (sigma-70 family)